MVYFYFSFENIVEIEHRVIINTHPIVRPTPEHLSTGSIFCVASLLIEPVKIQYNKCLIYFLRFLIFVDGLWVFPEWVNWLAIFPRETRFFSSPSFVIRNSEFEKNMKNGSEGNNFVGFLVRSFFDKPTAPCELFNVVDCVSYF